jgi:hypothetical protein
MAKRTIEHVDTLIARNERRLKLTMTNLDKLKKERKRLISKTLNLTDAPPREQGHIEMLGKPQTVKITSHPVANPDNVKLTFAPVKDPDANLDIPGFLRRAKEETENDFLQAAVDLVKQDPDLKKAFSDKAAADQLREEQATAKKAKAAGRIAKMKAKKSGELKKMPLSGKAALDAIRNG